MSDQVTFGSWLKARRKSLDITQEELAQQIACSPALIEKLEANTRRPSKQIAELLAVRLSVPTDERSDFVRFARSARTIASPADQVPWRTLRSRLTNLPISSTPFFGRQKERDTIVRRLVEDRVRLVTLVGPPGIGKTRLALDAAEALVDHFDDGVIFVPLAPVRDPDLVATAISRALGLKESGGQSALVAVQTYLAGKRLLLVLDNWEQVVVAAPLVAELLAHCRWLQVLATSRVSLHIRPERQIHIAPLALAPTDVSDARAVLTSPAVELFIDRAQAVDNEFAPDDENLHSIAQICARLDGLPLAIELVAAHMSACSPQELLAQLTSRLALGEQGPRDLPRRHQSLRDAIGWSYELLSEDEQTLFRSLAVFAGGFTSEMVQAVCGGGAADARVTTRLASLVDQNLVVQESLPGGESRFAMLETIREFAVERLGAGAEVEQLHRRHAEKVSALAEQAGAHLTGPEQHLWTRRLVREHGNVEVALQWAVDRGEAELALRIGSALSLFWYRQGWLTEGRKWLDRALALPSSSHAAPVLRLQALLGHGTLVWSHGDYETAERIASEGHALAINLDHKGKISEALHLKGNIAIDRGEYARAGDFHEQNLSLLRELGDRTGMVSALSSLGRIAYYRGDSERAVAYYDEILASWRARGDRFNIAVTLNNLGGALADNLELVRARQVLEEGRVLSQAAGEPLFVMVYILIHLGRTALYAGDDAEADDWLAQGLAEARARESKTGISFAQLHLGQLALRHGDPVLATRLLHEGLEIQRSFEEKGTALRWLVTLIALLLSRDDAASAATLSGAIESICELASIHLVPACAKEHAANVQALAAYEHRTLVAARERGRALRLCEALEFAARAIESKT